MTTVRKGSTNLEQRVWVVKSSDLSTGVWRGFEAIDKPTRSGTLPEAATNATRKVRLRTLLLKCQKRPTTVSKETY
jgi:hypothetical protein